MSPKASVKSTVNQLSTQIVTLADTATQDITLHDDNSNLDRLRRADFAKSPSQAAEVKSFLDNAQTRLAEYDQGIGQLKDALCRLEAARNVFERSIDIANTLIAPIHRIPEDVLVEIFGVYIAISVSSDILEDSWHNSHGVSLVLHPHTWCCPTLQLSHVCTFWRNVAFSRPTLWASLSLHLEVLADRRLCSKLLSLLPHYLSHSSSVPLSLKISDSGQSTGQNWQHRGVLVLNMLVAHCARWQCINLGINSNLYSLFLSALQSIDQPSTLPHLKVLHLCVKMSKPDSLLPIFAHAPNIENLHGRRLVLPWDKFREFSFKKLKVIRRVVLGGASIGQFLAQTPVLKECNLSSLSGLTVDKQDFCRTSSLTKLSIFLDECPPGIWQTLRIPNLASLDIDTYHFHDMRAIENTVEELSSMLLQSSCTLRQFNLKGNAVQYAIPLLRSNPSVERFMLYPFYDWTSDTLPVALRNFFTSLTVSEGSDEVPLVPNLQYFEVANVNFQSTDYISDIVRSRVGIVDGKRPSPLQEVVIRFVDLSSAYELHAVIPKIKMSCQILRSHLAPFVDSRLRLSLVEPNWDDFSFSGSSENEAIMEDNVGASGRSDSDSSEGSEIW